MPDEPESLILRQLREMPAAADRRFDEVMQELREIRTEAVADRSRVTTVDTAIIAVQRRMLRNDERMDDLARQVAKLVEGA